MMNQVVLVGRLEKDFEIRELESGKKVANIVFACNRPFKNSDGEHDTDYIDIILWDGIASNTKEYCHKGDLLGVKGRIQNNDETEHKNEIVAEKLTFLSSASNKD